MYEKHKGPEQQAVLRELPTLEDSCLVKFEGGSDEERYYLGAENGGISEM